VSKEKGPKAKTHSSPACGYAAEAGVFCFNFDKKLLCLKMEMSVQQYLKNDNLFLDYQFVS
jgi:hypothetical protein